MGRGQRAWAVLRWLPLALLLLLATVLTLGLTVRGAAAITAWYLLQGLLPLVGAVLLIATGAYALWKRRWSAPIALTLAGAALALIPALWLFEVWTVAFPASRAHTHPAAKVRIPLDGPVKVGWGGHRIETNYHAASPDQRWAYDLLVAPYLTGSPRLADYGCYGRPVRAPAEGVVAIAHDGEPDATPGRLSKNKEAPFGNYVALRLDSTGTFLILAHLQPGSVAVRAGQRVETGALLGRCGNSGNTSEPHLHLHHQRESPATVPVGFAEGLPLYFHGHDGPAMPEGGLRMQGGRPVATGVVVTHSGARGNMPPF